MVQGSLAALALSAGMANPATAAAAPAPTTTAGVDQCYAWSTGPKIGDRGYVKYTAMGVCDPAVAYMIVEGEIWWNDAPGGARIIAQDSFSDSGKYGGGTVSSKPGGFKDKPGKQEYCFDTHVVWGGLPYDDWDTVLCLKM